MDLLDIHNAIKADLGKEQAGYLSPGEIDSALDRAQMQEFWYLVADERKLQPGRPVPQVSYGLHRKIHHSLAPFKEEFETTATNYDSSTAPYGTAPNGVLVLPSDFEYLTGISGKFGSTAKRVTVINEEELDANLDSEIVAPSAAYRIGVIGGRGGVINGQDIGEKRKMQFFPESGFVAKFYYLRRPAKPVFAYTLTGRSLEYDLAGSTQMEWGDGEILRVIQRAVSILSKELQEREPYERELQENNI